MATHFQQQIKRKLILAAKAYSHLLGKSFIIESPSFLHRKRYVIRFLETNFLHLTGVETNLQSKEFYDKCVSGTIGIDDFWDSPKKNKSTIRKKLEHLVRVDSYFEQELLVQEDFAKNTIRCIIATTDGKCTIGFVDVRFYVIPNTILGKDCLDPTKPIIRVKPTY